MFIYKSSSHLINSLNCFLFIKYLSSQNLINSEKFLFQYNFVYVFLLWNRKLFLLYSSLRLFFFIFFSLKISVYPLILFPYFFRGLLLDWGCIAYVFGRIYSLITSIDFNSNSQIRMMTSGSNAFIYSILFL